MDAAVERAQMVEYQIEGRGIRDPAVLAAMLQVPRHLFVADRYHDFAYEDTPLPIPEGQTISQPYIVARMIELLQLKPQDRVLEIGAGSGYAAAVLSLIVREVYTVERLTSLADYARDRLAELGYTNVHVFCGDGTLGWPEHAPYDGIMVAAGGPGVPESLRQQLAVGGRLVIPTGAHPRIQRLIRLTRAGEDDYQQEKLDRVRFVPLIGQEGWESDE
ncbi:MAG: protein-L-isoaspartate(D-aspartate) O-methyltransferase [Chloroflexota bacterium]